MRCSVNTPEVFLRRLQFRLLDLSIGKTVTEGGNKEIKLVITTHKTIWCRILSSQCHGSMSEENIEKLN